MTQPGRRWARLGIALLLLLVLSGGALLLPILPAHNLTRFEAPAGADSVVVTLGPGYRGGALRRFLLGSEYRELWAEPIPVEVLRLSRFDGGLRPLREGGGVQTRTLHFVAASGRRYVFRSLDKENARLLARGLSKSLLAWLLNDQTSSSHPASALVAAPLQGAAGLPFPHPRLVLLAADSALGTFAPGYGGLPGTLLESPSEFERERSDSTSFDVSDTGPMLARLDSSAGHQVDAGAFLTARLLDVFLNDWDRHPGQWRWSQRLLPAGSLWRPIPVDRDQAFSWYDGAVLRLLRLWEPKLAEFRAEYPGLRGLTWNSAELDRRFLAGLSRASWDSAAAVLIRRLTDSVIDDAVRRMPEPYYRLSGAQLAATLKQRRGRLPEIAGRFYLRLAKNPTVHVAASGETARVTQLADGSVEVRLERGPVVRLTRRFDPAETRALELVLHGARETLLLEQRGTAPGPIALRVTDARGLAIPP